MQEPSINQSIENQGLPLGIKHGDIGRPRVSKPLISLALVQSLIQYPPITISIHQLDISHLALTSCHNSHPQFFHLVASLFATTPSLTLENSYYW